MNYNLIYNKALQSPPQTDTSSGQGGFNNEALQKLLQQLGGMGGGGGATGTPNLATKANAGGGGLMNLFKSAASGGMFV